MSQRRSMLNTGGPTRPPFLVGVALATLIVLNACSGGSGDSTTTASPAQSSTSSSAASSTSAITSTPSNPTTSEAGIRYVFLGAELGGRPEGQEFYDPDGHVLYGRLAESADFLAGMDRLLEGAKRFRVAMMCSEEPS